MNLASSLLRGLSFTSVIFLVSCSSDVPVSPDKPRVDLGGYYGSEALEEEDQVVQKRALVAKQQEEISRQAREIEDLKRQSYHNQKMRDYSKRTFKDGSESWTEGETEEWAADDGAKEQERQILDPSDERY